MNKNLNIAIIGTQFMGRAHSNAWANVARHFNVGLKPVLKIACGRKIDPRHRAFAEKYGWENLSDNWENVVSDPSIHVVDICTSNKTHFPIAMAAIESGKHVICEKPLAMHTEEARLMCEAAQQAGIVHMTAFNYRQVPAIIYAKELIKQGKIGEIRHFDAVYYQDWLIDPDFPFVWRNDIQEAGSGAHGDMNAHLVDLARFLVGEISSVAGVQKIFVKERPSEGGVKRTVTADDATSFLCHFEDGGLGSFITSRLATGRKNYLKFELFGSTGSIKFELERLNELLYYSNNDDQGTQGYRNILVTENVHPFIHAWWPPGHIIGWEHTFIHEIKQFIDAIEQSGEVQPSFYDGWKTQQVMDAVVLAASKHAWVSVT